MAEQSVDTTKVQLGKPVSFIGVTSSSMGDRFLTGAEMTHHQAYSSLEPGTHYTGYRQLNKLKSTLSKCLSCSNPLLGRLAGFCFFRAASLLSEPSLQLGLSVTVRSIYCLLLGGGA